jgi:hypothetical protein
VTKEQETVDTIRAAIGQLSECDQHEIKACRAKLYAMVRAYRGNGVMALALVGAEMSAEMAAAEGEP